MNGITAGIICAMEEEASLLRSWITEKSASETASFVFTQGRLDNTPVVLLKCGIGKVNAAAGCAVLLDRFHPSFVINSGSAGGFDAALRFGDVALGESVFHYDVDVTAFGYAPGQIPGQPEVFAGDARLLAIAEQAVLSLKAEGSLPPDFNARRCVIGSGDAFVGTDEKRAQILSAFPKIEVCEMEGAAIAQVASVFNTPCLVIRAISDIAGKESPVTFDEFLPLASQRSAQIVRRVVGLWKDTLH